MSKTVNVKKCNHETFYIDKNIVKRLGINYLEECGFGRGMIQCYDCNKTLKEIMDINNIKEEKDKHCWTLNALKTALEQLKSGVDVNIVIRDIEDYVKGLEGQT